MNSPTLIDALERFIDVLPAFVRGVSADDARWKPAGDAWSILEIVNHLADEETADFRPRLELTLTDPEADWPPIDPEGWAVERRYNEGDLDETVARFVSERRASVAWLRGLADPDWSIAHSHARLGSMRAGDLLASWTAHDVLHLRQIAKRLFEMVERDGGEYATAYAGSWSL